MLDILSNQYFTTMMLVFLIIFEGFNFTQRKRTKSILSNYYLKIFIYCIIIFIAINDISLSLISLIVLMSLESSNSTEVNTETEIETKVSEDDIANTMLYNEIEKLRQENGINPINDDQDINININLNDIDIEQNDIDITNIEQNDITSIEQNNITLNNDNNLQTISSNDEIIPRNSDFNPEYKQEDQAVTDNEVLNDLMKPKEHEHDNDQDDDHDHEPECNNNDDDYKITPDGIDAYNEHEYYYKLH